MKHEEEWKKAKKLCRLSNEDIRMARELGMGPRGLIKNIPNPKQRWKAPVAVWIRDLYEKKFGRKAQQPPPPAPRLVSSPSAPEEDFLEPDIIRMFEDDGPPTSDEIAEEDEHMLRQQERFRLAADYVAEALAEIEAVKKIVLFGSVAMPLEKEIPRFRKFRRARQPIYHECSDVDLAVWLSDLSILKSLQKARAKALAALLEEHDVGVAHHQVEVFLFSPETNAHLGRLCNFGECPKGKSECIVPNCGAEKFLRQVAGFVWRPDALSPAKTVTLYEHGVLMAGRGMDDSFDLPF
jgi:predicted nucleotidyltransferase